MNHSDDAFQVGLTSIERNDYRFFRPDCCERLGAYVVIDNTTGFRGLVSDKNEEVLPCIFDDVDVRLSEFIEVHFKGRYYEFFILSRDYKPKSLSNIYDFNGEIWYYRLMPNKRIGNYKNTGKEYAYVEMDDTTQQLVSLLNIKHSLEHNQ